MDKEQLLKAEIDKLISMGKANGSVTEEEIIAKLEKISVTPEEMEVVFKALAEAQITIKENVPDAELDKIIEGSVDDSVKMYLKDIGKVALLTAEDEVELAKRMKFMQNVWKRVTKRQRRFCPKPTSVLWFQSQNATLAVACNSLTSFKKATLVL